MQYNEFLKELKKYVAIECCAECVHFTEEQLQICKSITGRRSFKGILEALANDENGCRAEVSKALISAKERMIRDHLTEMCCAQEYSDEESDADSDVAGDESVHDAMSHKEETRIVLASSQEKRSENNVLDPGLMDDNANPWLRSKHMLRNLKHPCYHGKCMSFWAQAPSLDMRLENGVGDYAAVQDIHSSALQEETRIELAAAPETRLELAAARECRIEQTASQESRIEPFVVPESRIEQAASAYSYDDVEKREAVQHSYLEMCDEKAQMNRQARVSSSIDPVRNSDTLLQQPQQNATHVQNASKKERHAHRHQYFDEQAMKQYTRASNLRMSLLVLGALFGLIVCVLLLSCNSDLSGEAVGLLSAVSGIFGSCLKDIYSFEFGSSRGSKEKDGFRISTMC